LNVVITVAGVDEENGALPFGFTCATGATAAAAGTSPRTLCDNVLLCPIADAGLVECCDLLREWPIAECVLEPTPGRVLLANPGP